MKAILAIHGGAGTILKAQMTADKEKAYTHGLLDALEAGWNADRMSAVDMVAAAVRTLEDSPLFNAGKGAVFNHNGIHELDASIMEGRNLQAGAVAGVQHIENPILLAKLVLEESEHIMLCGAGAEDFAKDKGIPLVENTLFSTEFRREQLVEALAENKVQLDHSEKKIGTVGAVALDHQDNLAAATSTGGLTNKKFGRLGDTPIIGSGTYANNQTCAVSCTGHGEYFIRYAVAYDVACLMAYKGLSLDEAAKEVILQKLIKAGGEGGLIGIDRKGNVSLTFNSAGMYRGVLYEDGTMKTDIF